MGYVSSETEVLQTVLAANPWNNGLSAQFSVCVHYKGGVVPTHAVYDKRSRVQGYYLFSPFDNQYRPLPDALVKLWLDNKVPAQLLPGLLFGMESRPEKNDFSPHLSLTAGQRVIKIGGATVLGLIIACLGWLLYREGLEWGPVLSLAGIFFSGWYLFRWQRMNARRKSLTEWILTQLSIAGK